MKKAINLFSATMIAVVLSANNSAMASPLWDEMDTFFDPFLVRPWKGRATYQITQEGKNIIITIDVPGIPKNRIDLQVNEQSMLIVQGSTHTKTEEKQNNVSTMEIASRSFYQAIQLPYDIDVAKISATLKDGVLKIIIPGAAKVVKKGHKIAIQ